jgi:hypothetical protein
MPKKDDGGAKGADVKELSERIQKLEEALAEVARPYAELIGYIEKFQEVSKGYFKLMNVYQKHGKISPEMVIPGLKDPISRDLVTILMDKGALNISEAADALRDMRGHSSRRIVRERLQKMEEDGVVVATQRGKQKKYSVSEEVTNKWLEMLGMVKRVDGQ